MPVAQVRRSARKADPFADPDRLPAVRPCPRLRQFDRGAGPGADRPRRRRGLAPGDGGPAAPVPGQPDLGTIRRAATTDDTTAPRFTFDGPTERQRVLPGDASPATTIQLGRACDDTKVSAFRKITTHVKSRAAGGLRQGGAELHRQADDRRAQDLRAAATTRRVRTTLVGARKYLRGHADSPGPRSLVLAVDVTQATSKFIASHSAVVTRPDRRSLILGVGGSDGPGVGAGRAARRGRRRRAAGWPR